MGNPNHKETVLSKKDLKRAQQHQNTGKDELNDKFVNTTTRTNFK